jgi:hypothetical protein
VERENNEYFCDRRHRIWYQTFMPGFIQRYLWHIGQDWGLPPLLGGLALLYCLTAAITHRFRIETTGQTLESLQEPDQAGK